MSKILSTMAAVALMTSTAIAPAFAQTAAPAPSAPAATTAPAEPAMKSADPSVKPAGSASTMAPGAGGGYLTEQGATQLAASDYIGKSIYNSEDKSIGDVNDLILEENGGVVAAVVGVGGFLGIGEKNVALPIDKLTVTRGDNNDLRLTTTETAESLQGAPKFMTLAEQQTASTSSTDTTTTSSTTAPATPAAPADNATTPATPAKP